jgi:hypothetical protein
MWSRIHLIPLLQAEEDRDVVRRDFAQKAMERELLGKEVPIYNKDRYGHDPKSRAMPCFHTDWSQIRPTDVRRDSLECNKIDSHGDASGRKLCHVYIRRAWEKEMPNGPCSSCRCSAIIFMYGGSLFARIFNIITIIATQDALGEGPGMAHSNSLRRRYLYILCPKAQSDSLKPTKNSKLLIRGSSV